MGDSAGGNLAAAALLLARDRAQPLPAGQILLYPVVQSDFTDGSPFPSVHETGRTTC